jgi:putative redox protein
MRDVTVRTLPPGKHTQSVEVGGLQLVADEPLDFGGDDLGPAPHELLLAALGACTSMTLKIYADRKGWPLQSVNVKLTAEKGAEFVIQREIALTGDLTDEQRQGLLAIADKCPVHKTLTRPIKIESRLDR